MLRSQAVTWIVATTSLVTSGLNHVSAQDLGHMPWLDKPMRRFCYPTPHMAAACELGGVFGYFVKEVRVRASLEYRSPYLREITRGRVVIAMEAPTARRVLSEIVQQWSKAEPVVVTQNAGFLCLAEKALLADPTWLLNVRHVEGFEVRELSFDEVCWRVADAIAEAHEKEAPGDKPWVVYVNDYTPWSNFSPDGLPWDEPVSAEIRSGSARDMLCQVAMLQPNCFWGAEASWLIGKDGAVRRRSCKLMFGSWSDRREVRTEELLPMLAPDFAHGRGQNRYDVARDVLNELRIRGPRAIESLAAAYRASSDTKFKRQLLNDAYELCTWLENSRAVVRFATAERAREADPELASELADLAELTKQMLPDEADEDDLQVEHGARGEGAWPLGWWAVIAAAFVGVVLACSVAIALAARRSRRSAR